MSGKHITIIPKHEFSDIVCLVIEREHIGMVTCYKLIPGKQILYGVKWGCGNFEWHYDIEIEEATLPTI